MCNCHELDKYTVCEECVEDMFENDPICCRECGEEFGENPNARWDWLDVYGDICKECLERIEIEQDIAYAKEHRKLMDQSLNSSEL